MPRPSVHFPFTKSYAIDQIEDIELLRRVAHRMWEAFAACHAQSAHAIGALAMGECEPCRKYCTEDGAEPCAEWKAWQAKVSDGFRSV